MFIQKTRPEPGDPFFNTAAAGGVSTCIVIKNCAPGLNTLPNCVSAAVNSFNKAACKDLNHPKMQYLNYPPNAENDLDYAKKQGLPTSMIPELACIMVFRKGPTLTSADGAGHVIFVNAIDPDGTVHSSESEYNGRVWVNNTYKPCAFDPISLSSQGDLVRLLQTRLKEKAQKDPMFDPGNIDGDFGTKTERALVYYQFKNKIGTPDGVCGPLTQKSLNMLWNYRYGSAYTYIGSILLPKT